MSEVLKVNNLKKIYHTKNEEILALDNIDFSVEAGSFISIVGPSGCGKSTILSIIAGLIEKSDGNILLIDNYRVAYMLQDDCLLPYKTILENCLLGLKIQNKLDENSKNYVLSLLRAYGLEEFINKYPSNLSGGMRQRVALIRTLATKPDILLLDEATSALDYQTTLAISDDIYDIIKKEGKTAIMVTHDISLAISMSDKIIVLSKRPAVVKSVYDINLDTESIPTKRRNSKEFADYYEMIWRDLDVHV